MADPIEELDQQFRQLLRDMYSIGDSDAETLIEVATACAKTSGVTGALTVGAAAGVAGGTVTLGGLAMPAWVAGALAGMVSGTVICTMHNFTGSLAIDHFLKTSGHTHKQLGEELRSLVTRQPTLLQSTPTSRWERYRLHKYSAG